MRVADLETPALVVDLDVMEGNIRRLADYCREHGLKQRPHIKTHKVPAIAHKQIEAGAVGINRGQSGGGRGYGRGRHTGYLHRLPGGGR